MNKDILTIVIAALIFILLMTSLAIKSHRMYTLDDWCVINSNSTYEVPMHNIGFETIVERGEN